MSRVLFLGYVIGVPIERFIPAIPSSFPIRSIPIYILHVLHHS